MTKTTIIFGIITLTTILFIGCDSVDTNSKDLKAENENMKDSLADLKSTIDSLTNTDAYLFSTALGLEQNSTDQAVSIYKQLADKGNNTFFKTEAKNRIHYFEALQFLEYIKVPNADQTYVTTHHNTYGIDNIDTFMTFISSRGLEIYDANEIGNENTTYTREELIEQLTQKKGHAFQTITQLSYIYSLPYPQYSDTYYAVSTDFKGIYVRMQSHYRLSFYFEGNDEPYKLRKIESFHIDDL